MQGLGREGECHAEGIGEPDDLQEDPLALDQLVIHRRPGVWRPGPGTTWQWQLDGVLDTSFAVQMYDIDLFDHDASVFAALKAAGKVVICYFSAGSWESYRPDEGDFSEAVKGASLDPPFDDERWRRGRVWICAVPRSSSISASSIWLKVSRVLRSDCCQFPAVAAISSLRREIM